MGLFNWFRKKQIEAETPGPLRQYPHTPSEAFDPAMPDGDRTGMIPVRKVLTADEIAEIQGGPDEILGSGVSEVKPAIKRNPTHSFDDGWKGDPEMSDKILNAPVAKPKYKVKAVLTGTTLTAFLPGGSTVITNHGDHDMLVAVVGAQSEVEVRSIMLTEEVDISKPGLLEFEDRTLSEDIQEVLPEFIGTGEFEMRSGHLYLKGVDLSIPNILAKEIKKAGEMETPGQYDALKNFWCWCAANPDPVAREDTFGFLKRGDFKLTKRGFFLGFRDVQKIGEGKKADKALVEFISNKYMNIKTKQKKSPKNFEVLMDADGGYSLAKITPGLTCNDSLGNLADLYNNLTALEENIYTDLHSGTMQIKIGEPVKMDRADCDHDPTSSCSAGLHIKNKHFGHTNGFGNTSIVCIINPMNVVAVPRYENNKMRVCEYFPLAVVDGPWEKWLEDADTVQLEDEYVSTEVDNLVKMANDIRLNKITKSLDSGSSLMTQVAGKIEQYQKDIEGRVVKV